MAKQVAILGGGLAGLSLGRRLKAEGADFVVLEALPRAGGLCRGMRTGAHSWDLGPHAFYSKEPESLRPLRELPLSLRPLKRDVRICHRGPDGSVHEVGYPFEYGLRDLPLRDRLDCVAGYWRAWGPRHEDWRFRNLKHWIEAGLGRGISRCFMTPYNRKIWSVPLEKISMDLVNRKIEPERPWTILKNSVLGGGVGRPYQSEFLYPEAGAGAVPDAMALELDGRVRTGWEVRRLERKGGLWRMRSASGEEVSARRVVSTLPLPELLKALGELELARFLPAFRFNHTYFAMLGLKPGARPARFASCQWVFFAGPEAFYRVSMPHNFALRRQALVAEMTLAGAVEKASKDELLAGAVRDLRSCGLLPSEDSIETAGLHLEKYTYPIPTVGMPQAREELESLLSPRSLYLLGRSGRWEYLNTDGVFSAVDSFWRAREASLLGRDGGSS